MSARLWDKGDDVDQAMLRYTARDDWRLDERLLEHDIAASAAHVRGLGRIGVLSAEEVAALEGALRAIEAERRAGSFRLGPDDEDGHSALEAALVTRLGDVGRKVHTGRSRNDQVLVALRLYEKRTLAELIARTRQAALALCDAAERDHMTPMPGYTHMQRAVPSSVGLWLSAVAEGLADAADHLLTIGALLDRSPLGAAAGYGVNLPLDRDGVAADLGFASVADNPLASQSSRGVLEAVVLGAAWHVAAVVRRFAWDLSFFTTSEAGFVRLAPELTTGSSIMPNKRNPDIVELMRGSCAIVDGALAEIHGLVALPSGYHRDLQLTKAPLFRALDEVLATVTLLPRLVAGLEFDRARMREAISTECFATDRALEAAASGMPFREAYQRTAAELASLPAGDADASLRARVSPGAPGALRLEGLRRRVAPPTA